MPGVMRNGAARVRASISHRVRTAMAVAAIGLGALAFSSCSVMNVLSLKPTVDNQTRTSAFSSQPRGLARLTPSGIREAAYPFMSRPSGLDMPASEVECRRVLRRLGVTYRDLAPINDGASCGIAHPVQVSMLPGNIEMKPAATLTCAMAASFASWTREQLAPAARWRYLSGVKTIHQGSSYSCRRIAGTSTPSEHSQGNALDVMRIELSNGRDIDVRKPGWFSFRQRSLLNNVRSGGCQYFTTVLGPGYNAAHADHFHFDIKDRSNGYVACR